MFEHLKEVNRRAVVDGETFVSEIDGQPVTIYGRHGKHWVSVKSICHILGLSFACQARKLKYNSGHLWDPVIIAIKDENGRPRNTLLMPVWGVPPWLARIDATKVCEERRQAIVAMQEESARVFHHWATVIVPASRNS